MVFILFFFWGGGAVMVFIDNFVFLNTQYTKGLSSDSGRGDPGDCLWACCNMEFY